MLAEQDSQLIQGPVGCGDAIELHAVAGVENGVFLQAGQGAQLLLQAGQRTRIQREFFAPFQWSRVVGDTNDEEKRVRLTHGWTEGGTGGSSSPRRDELTG